MLRNRPGKALLSAIELLYRLRTRYRSNHADVLHINWLQNALPLLGLGRRAVITVLGTDFALLRLPGMQTALRQVLKSNHCILAPNASWMASELHRRFGDLAPVRPVNFGIDRGWYESARSPATPETWLAVTRVTQGKIGDLFSWGEGAFGEKRRLQLVGPLREQLAIPDWVDYHGPATPLQLQNELMPAATGLISLSRHAEGRPQVMLEAMAAGLPLVASDIDAHRSLIDDGSNGIIVRSPAELLGALDHFSCEEAEAFSRRARSSARSAFGLWSDCVSRYQALYRELI
jgi:hypothetical protein